MANIQLKCPNCGTENPVDIFKAEEGSRILCKGCSEFILLNFKDGQTPKKLKQDITKRIREAIPRKIKLKF